MLIHPPRITTEPKLLTIKRSHNRSLEVFKKQFLGGKFGDTNAR